MILSETLLENGDHVTSIFMPVKLKLTSQYNSLPRTSARRPLDFRWIAIFRDPSVAG